MKAQQEFLAFNRGLVSRLALARTDLARSKLSADRYVNYMPRALGSMMLRPGLEYTGATKSNAKSKTIPFNFSASDTARIEVTDSVLRFWVDDALITRDSVSTAFTNGDFDTDLTGWTDSDEVGGTSAWVTGGYMSLTGDGTNAAIRTQALSIASADQAVRHAIRVTVERGPIQLRIGTTSGASDIRSTVTLGKGVHSITFTPNAATAYVQLLSRDEHAGYVTSVSIESSGTLEIPAPWTEDDLGLLRYDQSGDVVFVACTGYQQRKIERRSNSSWSIVVYQPEDGPFLLQNTSPTTLTASALEGSCTVTASTPVFQSTHVGALFQHVSVGQTVSASLTANSQFTDPIRVTGIDNARIFSIVITGTFVATLTLQRSIGDTSNWQTVTTYTTVQNVSYDDSLDNQIIYYRIGTTAYTSGTAVATLTYASGSITGVLRVTEVASSTSATAEILTALGSTSATDNWSEGAWSDYRGWPSAVAFYEGRLWWAGKDKFWGSITDAFENFDPDYEGDAGPISRSIGSGPVDIISWLAPMQRLLAGTDGAVVSARSSSFDEPLTPTNFNVKTPSTQASARVQAVKVDSRVIFVQGGGMRLYQMAYSIESNDYDTKNLCDLVPEIGEPGFVGLAVQRRPDTRVHARRSDGTVAVLVFDPAEEVSCWLEVETDGEVEDICVMPGEDGEDDVYYTIKRTINGSTVRYHEKWARESECVGGSMSKCADSFVYSTSAGGQLSAAHLEGEEVVIWADGQDRGTATVTGGVIDLGGTYTNACAGLAYTARWRSAKLAYVIDQGWSGLGQVGRVNSVSFILADTHPQGVKYGRDFDNLDDLPRVIEGEEVDQDTTIANMDTVPVMFNGEFGADTRLCFQSAAPRPCTILAVVIGMMKSPAG